MYIWAFDLSMSCTGISIFSNDGVPVLVTSIETKSEKEHSGKLKLIADKVLELKKQYPAEKIVIENAFSRFNISTQTLYRVHGLINYLFWDAIEQIYFQATTIKKTVGGRGNLKKEEIKKFVLSRFPELKLTNLDESDSVSVGICYFLQKGVYKN